MKIKLYLLNFIIVSLAACTAVDQSNSDGGNISTFSQTPATISVAEVIQDDGFTEEQTTRTVSATPNPSETVTSIVLSTSTPGIQSPTPLPEGFSPPLPDILLSVAPNQNAIYSCVDQASLGQVWVLRYPYETGAVLLSEPNTGFYMPTWSSDGQRIAFLSLDIEEVQETDQENGTWRSFRDSIWVMRLDGTEYQQIADPFMRTEFISSETGACTVTAGITSIIGWSANSQWLIFTYLESAPETASTLYALNINTGDTQVVAEDVIESSVQIGSEGANISLIRSTQPPEIVLTTVDSLNFTSSVYYLPSNLPDDYLLYQVVQIGNGNELLVIGADRKKAFSAPATLWRVDLSTGEWQDVISLGTRSAFRLFSGGRVVLLCSSLNGIRNIEIFDPLTFTMTGMIENEIWCPSVTLFRDGNDSNVVSYTEISSRESIWVSSIYGESPVAEILVHGTDLGLPSGYEIVNYSWSR